MKNPFEEFEEKSKAIVTREKDIRKHASQTVIFKPT